MAEVFVSAQKAFVHFLFQHQKQIIVNLSCVVEELWVRYILDVMYYFPFCLFVGVL